MKNIDKYGQEILKQLGETGDWAMKDGKIDSCVSVPCELCAFNDWGDVDCSMVKAHWLNIDEDKKTKRFSQADKEVIRALTKVQWVARGKYGGVFGFTALPHKDVPSGFWELDRGEGYEVSLEAFSDATFDCIEWEDDRPTAREEILRG